MNNKSERSRGGKCVTFYSYKGGVGRSMALVNIACLLAKKEKKVLIVDWDLEAPGLHQFFNVGNEIPGLVELFTALKKYVSAEEVNNEQGFTAYFTENLAKYIEPNVPPKKGNSITIDILKAGLFDADYANKLRELNWKEIYEHSPSLFRCLAQYLAHNYDYVLIDSRTGLADTGGITTMLMPDKLVLVFALNDQNINGVLSIAKQAIDYRFDSFDYRRLDIYPLPSRVESKGSDDLQDWIDKYKHKFETLFTEKYELDECNLSAYFDRSVINYFPAHAHGENIPVLKESVENSSFISFDYNRFLTVLLENIPAWEVISNEQEREIGRTARELLLTANDLIFKGQFEKSIKLYDEIIELNPAEHELYLRRALSKSQIKDYEGAITDSDIAISLNRNNATLWESRGTIKILSNDYEGALFDLKEANRIKPSEYKVLVKIGNLLSVRGKFTEAIEEFDKAIQLQPKNYLTYIHRAFCKRNLKDAEAALADYNRAVELQPDSYEAYKHRGAHYFGVQNFEKAMADFNKSISLNLEYDEVYYLRGQLFLKLNDLESAKKDFKKAMELGSTDAATQYKNLIENP